MVEIPRKCKHILPSLQRKTMRYVLQRPSAIVLSGRVGYGLWGWQSMWRGAWGMVGGWERVY